MSNEPLKVLFLSSEVSPYSKTGGLADVSAALPAALAAQGLDVVVLSPRYGTLDRTANGITEHNPPLDFSVSMKGKSVRAEFSALHAGAGNPRVFFVECDAFYDRPGVYVDPFTHRDYIDNDYRFIVLCRAAFELCKALEWTPDILHCNDWQTGVAPLYLNQLRLKGEWRRLRSILTIHNIAYFGLFGPDTATRIGDAERYYYAGGPLEFYGHVSFLKAGLEFADRLNTVSPTYAHEIQSGYEYGFGMESVLRSRGDGVAGILNGIDVNVWNPQTDARIYERFDAENLDGKEANKKGLCAELGLEYREDVPLIGVISRLAAQKGFELIVPALDEILNMPASIALLGSGDPHLEYVFSDYARRHPDRCAVRIGYDEHLAHRIEAGADLFLMPSRYEPCGLNQMMSMRYGTLPVVRATGGLADTVKDAENWEQGTGFSFHAYRSDDLLHCLRRACVVYRHKDRWRRLQKHAMAQDFSWERSARVYMELYRDCLDEPPRVLI